jgi:Protein of unknown function (DUF2867)
VAPIECFAVMQYAQYYWHGVYNTSAKNVTHAAPQHRAHLPDLAHPRAHGRLPAQGHMGTADAGRPDGFPRLVQWWASRDDPSQAAASCAVCTLWAIRWKAGELLGWDGPDVGPGPERPTLHDRLPADLREAPSGPDFAALPFTSLYLTGDEWAAEIANRTVHGIMHLGWIPDGTGGYHGQMAVLVKPNGLFGTGYMAAIAPLRRLIVYPPMLREIGRGWRALPGDPAPADA